MVWPGEWFYQFATAIDEKVIGLVPALKNAPYRAYAEGFVGSYLTVTGVETLLRYGLQRVGQERLLRPLQIAGFATMAAIPVVVGIFDHETARATLAEPDYTAGLWGLFSGTGFRAAQSLSGFTNVRLTKAAFNGARNLFGISGLEERLRK